ncbi:MAG: T9SS type A sorting domain-containing protein [bacterium]
MKNKIILLLLIIFAGTNCPDFIGMSLKAQEQLPDTIWSKAIDDEHLINVVKFSLDGKYIFTGVMEPGRALVYKVETSTGLVVDSLAYHPPLIKKLILSPTGDTLIVTGSRYIWLWDIKTGDTIFTLNLGEEACFTPDGKRIIATTGKSGFDEPQILIIDIETKEIIKSFIGRYYKASNLQFSSDGNFFSFNDFRGTYTTVILIDLNTFEELKIFEKPGGTYTNLGFTPNNRYLGTASSEGIHLWDLNTLELYKTNKYYETTNVSDLGMSNFNYSNESDYFMYAYWDQLDFDPNKIIVWDIEGDSLKYQYDFSGTKSIDLSKYDYIASVGFVSMKGFYFYMLRPNWIETNVKEIKEENFKYSYNNKKMKIEFNENLINEPKIHIYNILGVGANGSSPVQLGNTIEIDLEDLSSGIYFVEVLVNGKTYFLKINNY